jgi:hypothetical protein
MFLGLLWVLDGGRPLRSTLLAMTTVTAATVVGRGQLPLATPPRSRGGGSNRVA